MDLEILLILGIAIFCGFFVQTLVGFAGSLVALPILLIAIKLPDAIAYVSIFYLFSSSYLVKKEWKNINKNVILKLTFASVIGVVLGIVVLTCSKPVVLQKALGVFILLYIVYALRGQKEINTNKTVNWVLGALGGFFSGVFSTGGPLYVISIKNTVEEIKVFRATMIGVLALVTIVRVPALALSGTLTFQHVKTSLMILPIFILAQYLGTLLFPKINEVLFKRLLLVLLFFSGIGLIV
ncbi:TSUP family transporter [Salinimicrobium sp. GXAS 041]|uniref:TSUP family transporter n=1 Tax=Salinimicrobium sp. GXAS 041 TaxID=3400806 RepID=UPI003C70A323